MAPEQVVGGRLFIQGMNSLSARDVYRTRSGNEFDDLGSSRIYNETTNTPLSIAYNQSTFRATRQGNYVATADFTWP
jgi:hypothetical protein